MPNLPVTVDYDLWEAMAKATSSDFADSYLSGAELHSGRFLPRTQTAWMRLTESYAAMRVFAERQIKVLKPPPFDSSTNVQLSRAA